MYQRFAWFRTLSAAHRSSVTLVAQAGIFGYLEWLVAPAHASMSITAAVFGNAPRELLRAVSLRRTVELVRIAIAIAEEHFPPLAQTAEEKMILTDSLLRYSREVAFSAAALYAAAAESRGAWDERLEAMVVDAIVRGESGDELDSRAAALNWDTARPVVVLAGTGGPAVGESFVLPVGAATLSGRQAGRHLVVLSAPTADELPAAVAGLLDQFGPGPVVTGPTGIGLPGAIDSARHALAALRAAPAWSNAPRGVEADSLWPERVLSGDAEAAQLLRRSVFDVVHGAGQSLLETIDAYLGHGRALENTARVLFVHANTVRYRLRRVFELTGLDPFVAHDAFALQVGLALGRLDQPADNAGGASTTRLAFG